MRRVLASLLLAAVLAFAAVRFGAGRAMPQGRPCERAALRGAERGDDRLAHGLRADGRRVVAVRLQIVGHVLAL